MKIYKEHVNVTVTLNPDLIQLRFGDVDLSTGQIVLDGTALAIPMATAVQMAQIILNGAAQCDKLKADGAAPEAAARLQ